MHKQCCCDALHGSSRIVWCLSVRTCSPTMPGSTKGSACSGSAITASSCCAHANCCSVSRPGLRRWCSTWAAAQLSTGWLVARGHRVHLVDVVPEHVRAAAEHGLVTAEIGDARRLTQADASVATHPPLLPTQIARGASPWPRFRSLTHIWSDRGRAVIVTRSRIADAAEGARLAGRIN
jgi:uncharacterized protein YraI